MKTLSGYIRHLFMPAMLLATLAPARAQTAPDAGSLLRESERPQPLLPVPVPKAIPQRPATPPAEGIRVKVKGFRLTGNTLLSDATVQAVLAPWLGKEAGFGDLEQALNAIAEAYRKRGWLARPQLPAQDIHEGIITINILEGKLGEIRIDDGGKSLRIEHSLVTKTMTARQQPGDMLNLDSLERASNILNDTPGVAVATVLAAGKEPAESDAIVKVQDKSLLAGTAMLDNTGSRSTGEEKLSLALSIDNPTGRGDQIGVNGNASDGNTYFKLSYSLSVGHDGLRAGMSASTLNYTLVGADFQALKSKGDAQTYGILITYPLQRSGTANVSVAGAYDLKDYYNESNSVATSAKRIRSGLVSFTGDMLDGLGDGGMTMWGVNLTIGNLDLSPNLTNQNTDRNGPRTEGSYTRLGGNLARLQRLSDKATLWAMITAQKAGKNLDSSEKMSLGGPSAVRAYPVMEAAGDEGWQGTLEARYNLTPDVQVVGFYDHGVINQVHNANYAGAPVVNTGTLKGAGFGFGWSQAGKFSLRTTWARRIGENPFRTLATGKDQDGSYDRNRLWLSGIVYF